MRKDTAQVTALKYIYIYAGTVSEYMCAKYTRVAHIKRMIQVCKGICGQTDPEICQTCLPRNLNNAVFFADDEFDDSASGNRAASSSSEDPVRSLGAIYVARVNHVFSMLRLQVAQKATTVVTAISIIP